MLLLKRFKIASGCVVAHAYLVRPFLAHSNQPSKSKSLINSILNTVLIFFFSLSSLVKYIQRAHLAPDDPSRDTLARQRDFLSRFLSPSPVISHLAKAEARRRLFPFLPSPFFNPLHLMRGISIGNLPKLRLPLTKSIRRTSLLIFSSR